ncbi:hypothetical protein KC867_01455, partial [Candidatus Saccharibacteria bacterium]|nr:hypothetical protein [Candidatus Saccharibacteria bacterium]
MSTSNFVYKTYQIGNDQQTVSFDYTSVHDGNNYNFTEVIQFPQPLLDTPSIHNALQSLHLALGISYYKIFVNQTINHPYYMDAAKAGFWNNVFLNGLGEFLYVNRLHHDRLAKFTPQNGTPTFDVEPTDQYQERAMMGIGGGKDSILAGELLKSINLPIDGFVMATGNQLGQAQDVAKVMGVDLLAIKRTLDQSLLTVQETAGAYKGHVPISLIFGLVGCVLAINQKAKYVVVANESSASIPRVIWQDNDINHQWSKSFEFEQLFQDYTHQYINQNVTYFSAIRPLSSIAIVKQFAKYKPYLPVFTSDNSVFKINSADRPHNRWSLNSPKSLSSFILLSPWLTEEELITTFERNFMDEASLEDLLYELIGHKGHQPLDCVGTEEELLLSISLAYQQGKLQRTYLMQKLVDKHLVRVSEDVKHSTPLAIMLRPSPEHAIPTEIYS